jgi:hypothetical protein
MDDEDDEALRCRHVHLAAAALVLNYGHTLTLLYCRVPIVDFLGIVLVKKFCRITGGAEVEHMVGGWQRLLVLSTLLVSMAHAGSPTAPSLQRTPPPLTGECTSDDIHRLRGGAFSAEDGMLGELRTWHPVLLALLGTGFGWFMTALGSAAVVIHKIGLGDRSYRKLLDFMLGLSGGVMTAASYWSLLAPALELAEQAGWGGHAYIPVAIGFVTGGALLQGMDYLLSTSIPIEEMDLYKV